METNNQPQIVYAKSSGFGGGTIFIASLIIALLAGGALWYFFLRDKQAPLFNFGSDSNGGAGTGELTNSYESPLQSDKPWQTPPSNTGSTSGSGNTATSQANNMFPLKLAVGADLHKVNPYVKDVQQYCNKFGGTNIDVDGAFGKQTEAAVLKTLGTKTITREQYNQYIAPALGKPVV